MFPKSKFHETLKPALKLLFQIFEPQGDVHNWTITKPESRILYDTFEELKATTEENFQRFLEAARHGDVAPGAAENSANYFKGFYDSAEKSLIVVCENEPWYRFEIHRAMFTLKRKLEESKLQAKTVEEFFDLHGFARD